MSKEKIILLIAILLAGLIFGGFYYKNQAYKIEAEKERRIIEDKKNEEEKNQEKTDKCSERAEDVRKKIKEKNELTGAVVAETFEDIFYSNKIDDCLYLTETTSYLDKTLKSKFLLRRVANDEVVDRLDKESMDDTSGIVQLKEKYR